MRRDPYTGIFNGTYLNQRVRFNVQDTFLEEDLSEDGLTCDPRAFTEVPEEVINAHPPDTEIVQL
jgi:hypothetical protein